MKKLLLALLLSAGSAYAQDVPSPPAPTEPGPPAGEEASAPFKLASVIVIHIADNTRTAYQKLTGLLLAQGYQVVEADSAQRRIITDYHRSA